MAYFVVAKRSKEGEDTQPTLSGNAGTSGHVFTGFVFDVEFDPLTAIGVDSAGDELVLLHVAEAVPLARLENDTW